MSTSKQKQNNQSNYAEERAAAQQRTPLRCDPRKKDTGARIADLERLLVVCKHLYAQGCLIHYFLSTDDKPLVYIEPCGLFKQLIVGKCVYINSRRRVGKVVQIECHVLMNEVKVCWAEVVFKDAPDGEIK